MTSTAKPAITPTTTPTMVPTLDFFCAAGQMSSEKEEMAVVQDESTVTVSDSTEMTGAVETQVCMLDTMLSLVAGSTVKTRERKITWVASLGQVKSLSVKSRARRGQLQLEDTALMISSTIASIFACLFWTCKIKCQHSLQCRHVYWSYNGNGIVTIHRYMLCTSKIG